MDPSLIAMAVSALGSIAGNALKKKNSVAGTVASNLANQYSQYMSNRAAQNDAIRYQGQLYNLQNKYQQRFWDATFRAQNNRQDYLNKYAATIQKQSLRQAGLSAASLNDSPFGTAAASGAVGGSVPGFAPMGLDLMSIRNAEAQTSSLQASAEKASAEAEKIRMENANYNEWYNIQKNLALAQTDVEKAQSKYTNGKNAREWRLITPQVQGVKLQNDILRGQKTLQDLEIEAQKKIYDIDGKQVKGSEIPNFKELWTLAVAAETLKINWYNAMTNRQSVENDPRKAITDILQPLAEKLKRLFDDDPDNHLMNSINDLIDFLATGDFGDKGSFPRLLFGPIPSIVDWWKSRRK